MFFSVPYDEGLSSTVNGSPVEVEKVNAGFMAVLVPEGESTIRFTYITPGLENGIIITLLSAIILIFYAIIYRLVSRGKKAETSYPEGDRLLVQWRMQELKEAANALESIPTEPKKPSILDNTPKPELKERPSFEGGFKINTDIIDDE